MRRTALTMTLAVLAVTITVAAAQAAGPPLTGKVARSTPPPADRARVMKDAALARRAAPKFVSGFHAGMAASRELLHPDLVNHMPTVDHNDYKFDGNPDSAAALWGFGTYFSAVNVGALTAPSSILRLECQFIVVKPFPDEAHRLAAERLHCGHVVGVFSLPSVPPGQVSTGIKVYIMPGWCTSPPSDWPWGEGYPRVKATVDATGAIDEGADGEKNNWMWVNFCSPWPLGADGRLVQQEDWRLREGLPGTRYRRAVSSMRLRSASPRGMIGTGYLVPTPTLAATATA